MLVLAVLADTWLRVGLGGASRAGTLNFQEAWLLAQDQGRLGSVVLTVLCHPSDLTDSFSELPNNRLQWRIS